MRRGLPLSETVLTEMPELSDTFPSKEKIRKPFQIFLSSENTPNTNVTSNKGHKNRNIFRYNFELWKGAEEEINMIHQ